MVTFTHTVSKNSVEFSTDVNLFWKDCVSHNVPICDQNTAAMYFGMTGNGQKHSFKYSLRVGHLCHLTILKHATTMSNNCRVQVEWVEVSVPTFVNESIPTERWRACMNGIQSTSFENHMERFRRIANEMQVRRLLEQQNDFDSRDALHRHFAGLLQYIVCSTYIATKVQARPLTATEEKEMESYLQKVLIDNI